MGRWDVGIYLLLMSETTRNAVGPLQSVTERPREVKRR
jgi:hypothetical protein